MDNSFGLGTIIKLHDKTEKSMFAPEVLRGSVEIIDLARKYVPEDEMEDVITLLTHLVGATARSAAILSASVFVPEAELQRGLEEFLAMNRNEGGEGDE